MTNAESERGRSPRPRTPSGKAHASEERIVLEMEREHEGCLRRFELPPCAVLAPAGFGLVIVILILIISDPQVSNHELSDSLPCATAKQKGIPKRFAFLIGVPDSDEDSLPFAETDATALRHRFDSSEFDTIVLTGHDSTSKENIIGHLRSVVREYFADIDTSSSFRDNLLIVAYHGHGLQMIPHDVGEVSSQAEDVLLATSDYDARKAETQLYLSQLVEEIEAKQNLTSLLMIDACRELTRESVFSRDLTRSFESKNRMGIFFSCARGELAWSVRDLQHSLFTWAVLEGLKGNASRNRTEITVEDLVGYVIEQTKLKCGRRFEENPHEQQHPLLIGNLPDDLVLLRLSPAMNAHLDFPKAP